MADNSTDCTNGYSGGSLAGAIVGTFAGTLLLLGLIYLVWEWQKKRRIKRSGLHNLVIVEDGGGSTSGGGDSKGFAYDNPGFIDESEAKKSNQGGGLDAKFNEAKKPANQQAAAKKMPWGPLSFLFKSRNALDDSVVEEPQKYNVALKGHDFTGLGFNICGNMRDGIFVKDLMQRGPAAECKEILAGDQITGMTVSFKQMVLEDAITLLSYASPYEVNLEMLRLPEKSLPHKGIFVSSPSHPSTVSSGQTGTLERVCHPFFKSQSIDDLRKVGKEHLDLQVDRKKKETNGIQTSKGSDSSATVSSGTMEIPTVVVVGNNENRSSSSPSKSTSSTVKLPKLPKFGFSFSSSPKSAKSPEAHQKSSDSSASPQIQIPMPDEVDGAIVSATKPEVVPRTKTKSTLVQKSTDDMELVEAISPAIDKMTAEFEKSKKEMKEGASAVLDVQPVEIDMKGQPSVKVESSMPDVRAPSMQIVTEKKSKDKEGKKKEKKSSKQKSVDIDLTPPSVSMKAGVDMDVGESKQEEVKKPKRSKSKDKLEKTKKDDKQKAQEKETDKENEKEVEQSESTPGPSGEKSKFFKFGIPVLPDISFNFGKGGNKSSTEEKDKEGKEKDKKEKEGKNKGAKDNEEKSDEKVELSEIKVEIPKVSLEVQEKSPKPASSEETPEKEKSDKKDKEPKEKKSKEKKKEKKEKEPKADSAAAGTSEEKPAEETPSKEKSGSSFSFNIKLPTFDKPLLKRKDSSSSTSGETGEKAVDSSPNASGSKDEVKSPKDEKSSEMAPTKPKKKSKAEKKASSRPTSPEVSDGHRTTDDEGDKSMDIVDTIPGEKSKKGSGFHMPHIGIKLPKFGHSKQTYSFENVGENKHGHGPTAESLLEASPSMKVEVSATTPEFRGMTPTVDEIVPEVTVKSESMQESAEKKKKDEVDSKEVKVEIQAPKVAVPTMSIEIPSASVEVSKDQKEMSSAPADSEGKEGIKSEDDDAAKKEKESRPSLVSKGLKGLRDLKEKVTHRLSLDHQQQASDASGDEDGDPSDENKMMKEKAKKEKKAKELELQEKLKEEKKAKELELQEKLKEEKQREKEEKQKEKEEKLKEKEEKQKEKERIKAEKKLKKAELKKKSGGNSSSSSSSSDESDAEDGKTEKKGKKKSKKKESKSKDKKSLKKDKKGEKEEKSSSAIEVKGEMPGIEVQMSEITASTAIEQKQLSGHEAKLIPVKPPVVPRKSKDSKEESMKMDEDPETAAVKQKLKKTKSKGGSSSSSSSSESESENKKEGKEGKPKKPKRTPKRKAPEIPQATVDVPDIVKITTNAEVMSPPKEEEVSKSGDGDNRESSPPSKTPESGRRSASFGDLSSLQQPKSKSDGPLERAMSMDMAGDKENSTEQGTMPVGSSMEDLSAIPETKMVAHLSRDQHHQQGLRDSMVSNTSTSSNETLKAAGTSVIQVHPKDQSMPEEGTSVKVSVAGMHSASKSPEPSTVHKMMNETLSVMNNIVHEMDSPSLVKSAMNPATPSASSELESPTQVSQVRFMKAVIDEKSEVERVAEKAVDEILAMAPSQISQVKLAEPSTDDKSEVERVAQEAVDEILAMAPSQISQVKVTEPSTEDKAEVEKIADETIDEIMTKARKSFPRVSVTFNESEGKEPEEPKVSVTTGTVDPVDLAQSLTEVESGADSFSIASVKIQGVDAEGDEPVSVRNITVTNIKSEPKADEVEAPVAADDDSGDSKKQLLREDSKQRLLQTVADANTIKASTPLRKDSSLSSSSCSVDSSPDTKAESTPLKPNFSVETAAQPETNGKSNGQTIEISSEELDGIMMSHADFLQKQAIAGASAQEDSLDESGNLNQQLKDTFDSWVYVEQKNAAHEHTCPHSHSDPEPSTASSNDDDEGSYGRNGALSPTTYRMETEYKFETSEMRVTSSPIPPEEAQVKSQSTVYSTTMTLPQKTVTQITLGDPVIDAGGRIVSKITLDTSSQNPEEVTSNKTPNTSAEVDLGKLPNLESLK